MRVECRSEITYAEEPRAFFLNGVRVAVGEVLSRWRSPLGPAFRVRGGGVVVVLQFNESTDRWTLSLETPIETGQARTR